MTSIGPTSPSALHRGEAAWLWLQEQLGTPVPSFFAVIGLEDGALLEALERHAPATAVLALEPDRRQAEAFLASTTAKKWLAAGRLKYLVDPDYTGADEAWRLFPTRVIAPPVVINPTLTLGEGVARAAKRLKGILAGVEGNAAARARMAPRYLTNSLRNIPALAIGHDVRGLTDAYRGCPAIVVGAGPSLDKHLDELRTHAGRAVIIAVDTALRPLLMAGVSPQFAIGLDPSTANARHLLSMPECRDTWWVAESALDPAAVAPFADRTFWFQVSNHHPWPWLTTIGIDVGRLDVWGSVLTGAFQLAVLAGCDPIVFAGADLAFTGRRPYARGTTYEFDWSAAAAEGCPLAQTWQAHLARTTSSPTDDIRGQETLSNSTLLSVRDWLVARAKTSGRHVINATGDGTLFGDGIEQQALSAALAGTMATIADPGRFARPAASATRDRLTSALDGVRQALAAGAPYRSPVHEWADFSGNGFDANLLSQALECAAAGLQDRSPAVAATTLTAWTARERLLFPVVPEAILRLRAALIDGTVEPPSIPGHDVDDRVAFLLDAWRRLQEIHAALLAGDDLPPRLDAACPTLSPLRAVYQWPPSVRWAVDIFEALLGRAARRVPMAAAIAFLRGDRTLADAAQLTPPRAVPIGHPHASHAVARLAGEWLRVMTGLTDGTSVPHAEVLGLWQYVERVLTPEATVDDDAASGLRVSLVVEHRDTPHSLSLALPAAPAAILRHTRTPAPLGRIEHGNLTVSLILRSHDDVT